MTRPHVQAPGGISQKAIDEHGEVTADENALIVFDAETGMGGFYMADTGQWRTYGPFQSAAEWQRFYGQAIGMASQLSQMTKH